jgi:DNA-directed RNA polymerase specialized sigma24 family protein
LGERFGRMTPAEREAFFAGAGAQNRAGAVHDFMQSMPKEERRATREMLEGFTPAQRMAFIRAWRALPVEQRDDYRRQLLSMPPEQRSAALAH